MSAGPRSDPGDAQRDRVPAALAARLGPDETVSFVLTGIGAVMVGTEWRVMLSRDDAGRRPRTGFREFELSAITAVRIEQSGHRSGRIVLQLGPLYHQAVSMFFGADDGRAAAEAAVALRRAVARTRRRSGASGHG